MSNPIHSTINAWEETRGNITALRSTLKQRDQGPSPPQTHCSLCPALVKIQHFLHMRRQHRTFFITSPSSFSCPHHHHHFKLLYSQQFFNYCDFQCNIQLSGEWGKTCSNEKAITLLLWIWTDVLPANALQVKLRERILVRTIAATEEKKTQRTSSVQCKWYSTDRPHIPLHNWHSHA